MLGAPRIKAVRGFSDFGFSYVYVIFEDALTSTGRAAARLNTSRKSSRGYRKGCRRSWPGCDERGLGLSVRPRGQDRPERPRPTAICPGLVSPLPASIGFGRGRSGIDRRIPKAYQVNIDPSKLLAFTFRSLRWSRRSGTATRCGGALVEFSGAEYMVRGRGYVKSVADIEKIVVGADKQGTPILVKNLGSVAVGPEIRRGIADLDGEGDTWGGIVIMRAGEKRFECH